MAVATEPKVSGAPGSGPVLDPDSLKQFGEAVKADHVYEPPAPPAPPAPAAPEPKVETPAAEPPPAAEAPPSEPAPETDPLKIAQAKVAEYERQIAQERERFDLEVRAMAGKKLHEVAAAQPWLAPYIYGEKDPALEPPQPPAAQPRPGEAPPPADPLQARIAAIEKGNQDLARQLAEERKWREQRERESILDDIQAKAEVEMKKYPQLRDGHPLYLFGADLIGSKIVREPKTPVEQIVQRVGTFLKDAEEKIKGDYVKGKKEAAAKVPPGAGGGAPAPPGTPPPKYQLGDSRLPRAFAAAMDAAQGKGQ